MKIKVRKKAKPLFKLRLTAIAVIDLFMTAQEYSLQAGIYLTVTFRG